MLLVSACKWGNCPFAQRVWRRCRTDVTVSLGERVHPWGMSRSDVSGNCTEWMRIVTRLGTWVCSVSEYKRRRKECICKRLPLSKTNSDFSKVRDEDALPHFRYCHARFVHFRSCRNECKSLSLRWYFIVSIPMQLLSLYIMKEQANRHRTDAPAYLTEAINDNEFSALKSSQYNNDEVEHSIAVHRTKIVASQMTKAMSAWRRHIIKELIEERLRYLAEVQ